MPPQWIRKFSEVGPDLKLFRVRFDHMQNPRNGHVEKMVILQSTDSAHVIARTAEGMIVLVRQYRFGIGRHTLELPGGIVGAEEEPAAAVVRELAEETGYTADTVEFLGRNPINPVYQDAYLHTFFADDVRLTNQTAQDAGEDVEVVLLPEAEVKDRLLRGEFEHPHAVAGLVHYFARRGF